MFFYVIRLKKMFFSCNIWILLQNWIIFYYMKKLDSNTKLEYNIKLDNITKFGNIAKLDDSVCV